jgi:hypothetical protein
MQDEMQDGFANMLLLLGFQGAIDGFDPRHRHHRKTSLKCGVFSIIQCLQGFSGVSNT